MSSTMDLIVWQESEGKAIGFQLCYDKDLYEKAITWTDGNKSVHAAIDSGEGSGMKHNESPILVADGAPDYSYIAESFLINSGKLPLEVIDLVMRILSARIWHCIPEATQCQVEPDTGLP